MPIQGKPAAHKSHRKQKEGWRVIQMNFADKHHILFLFAQYTKHTTRHRRKLWSIDVTSLYLTIMNNMHSVVKCSGTVPVLVPCCLRSTIPQRPVLHRCLLDRLVRRCRRNRYHHRSTKEAVAAAVRKKKHFRPPKNLRHLQRSMHRGLIKKATCKM